MKSTMLEMGREAICTKRHFFVFNLSFEKSCYEGDDNYLKPTSRRLEGDLKKKLREGCLKVTEGNFVLTDKKEERNDHSKNSKNFKKIMKIFSFMKIFDEMKKRKDVQRCI